MLPSLRYFVITCNACTSNLLIKFNLTYNYNKLVPPIEFVGIAQIEIDQLQANLLYTGRDANQHDNVCAPFTRAQKCRIKEK